MYTPHQVVTVYQERNYNGSDSNNMCEHGANKTPSTLTQPNEVKLPSTKFHYTIISQLNAKGSSCYTQLVRNHPNLLESLGNREST